MVSNNTSSKSFNNNNKGINNMNVDIIQETSGQETTDQPTTASSLGGNKVENQTGEPMKLDFVLEHLISAHPTAQIVFDMSHVDMEETGQIFVSGTQGIVGNALANANHFDSILDRGYEEKTSTITPVMNVNGKIVGPVSQLLGNEYANTQSTARLYEISEASFRSSQIRAWYGVDKGYKMDESIGWLSLGALLGWTLPENSTDRVTFTLFDALTKGQSGRPSQMEHISGQGVPRAIATVRKNIRHLVMNGTLSDVGIESLRKNGQIIKVYQPLMEILNINPELLKEFIVIGQVNEYENHDEWDDEHKKLIKQQTRIYCNRLILVYLPDPAGVITASPEAYSVDGSRREYFPWLPQGEVLPSEYNHAAQKGAAALKKVVVPAEVETKTIEQVIEELPTKTTHMMDVHEPKLMFVVDDPTAEVEPERQAGVVITDEIAKMIAEIEEELATLPDSQLGAELDVLHNYQNALGYHHAKPLEEGLSVEEILDIFDDSKKEVEMYKSLYPGIGAKELAARVKASGEAGRVVADAMRLYVLSRTDSKFTNPLQPNLRHSRWGISNLRDLITIVHELGLGVVNGKSIQDLIDIKSVGEDTFVMIGGVEAFRIDKELVVYDAPRGRSFQNTISIGKGGHIYGLGDSMSNFMHTLFYTFCPIMAANKGLNFWDNLGASIQSVMNGVPELGCVTEDKVLEQNGAARFSMKATFVPIQNVFYPIINTSGKNKHDWINISGGNGKNSIGAKALIKEYTYSHLKEVDDWEWMEAIKSAMPEAAKQFSLGFHYANKVFKAAQIGFGKFDSLLILCPTLLGMIEKYLDIKAKEAEIIVTSDKVEKGLKRDELANAHSAKLEKEYKAGYFRKGQSPKNRVAGALSRIVMSITMPTCPGMSGWVGLPSNKPIAIIAKGVTNIAKNDYYLGEEGHPFNLDNSNIPEMKGITYHQYLGADGWNYLTFDRPVHVKGDRREIICTVNKTTDIMFDCAGQLKHNRYVEGALCGLKWKEVTSIVSGKSQLSITYEVGWTERERKGRSGFKFNLMDMDKSFLFNEMNGDVFAGMEDEIDIIHFQDGWKAGSLIYGWLPIIGNTLAYNFGSTHPVYRELYKLCKEVNHVLGAPWNKYEPLLCIEPLAVPGGVYDKLLEFFARNFTISYTWGMFDQSPVQARMMYEHTTTQCELTKLAIEKGSEDKYKTWVAVEGLPILEDPALGDLEETLAKKPIPEGYSWQIFREYGAWTRNTNVLAFLMDGDGIPVAHAQRANVIAGLPGLPVYDVDLFEVSTIKENLGTSSILYETIKSLRIVIEDVDLMRTIQKRMIKEGAKSIMTLKYLASMMAGHTFSEVSWDEAAQESVTKPKKIIPLNVGDTINLSPADRVYLIEKLAEGNVHIGLDLESHSPDGFAKVCAAFKDIVFQLKPEAGVGFEGEEVATGFYPEEGEEGGGYSESEEITVWMPALLSFTKLINSSDTNQDFVARFYNNILLGVLYGESIPAIEAAMFKGIVSSLVKSENTIKLGNGGKNTGHKRIGLPNLPVGRRVVAYSEETNSDWQQLKRDGVPVDLLLADGGGEDVFGVVYRAPLAAGAIVLLQAAITKEDGKQYLVPLKKDLEAGATGILSGKEAMVYRVSTVQIACDAWTVYLDQGDFDGDTEYFTYLSEITDRKYITTYEQVAEIQARALGQDMWKSGVLAADHYNIKRWSKVTSSLGYLVDSIDSEGNPILVYKDIKGMLKNVIQNIDAYTDYNSWAFHIQNIGVGTAYAVYMLGDTMIEIALLLKGQNLEVPTELLPLLDRAKGADPESLVLVVSTLYEILLGGYDEAAKGLCTLFFDRIAKGEDLDKDKDSEGKIIGNSDISEENISKLCDILLDLKLDGTRAREVYCLMKCTSKIYRYSKAGKDGFPAPAGDGKDFTQDFNYWGALALVVFEFSRGGFLGFNGLVRPVLGEKKQYWGHRNAVLRTFTLLNKIEESTDTRMGELIDGSVTLLIGKYIQDHLYEELLLTKVVETGNIPEGDKYGIMWMPNQLNFFLKDLPQPKSLLIAIPHVEVKAESIYKVSEKLLDTLATFIGTRKLDNSIATFMQCVEHMATLNAEQQAVLISVFGGRHVFLSGKPGAGKSYTLGIIRKLYHLLGVAHIVVGSTGISVMNIGGDATFNSFFGLGCGFEDPKDKGNKNYRPTRSEYEDMMHSIIANKKVNNALKDVIRVNGEHDIPIIVDEVSMLDSLLLTVVDDTLCSNILKGFGTQNLQVGDPGQMEPVGGDLFFKDVLLKDDVEGKDKIRKYPSVLNYYQELGLVDKFELEQNQRAKDDPEFCEELDLLRLGVGRGRKLPKGIGAKVAWCAVHPDELPEKAVHIMLNNNEVADFNEAATAKMIEAGAESRTYTSIVNTKLESAGEWWFKGEGDEKEFILSPLGFEMILCVGMPIMMKKNLYDESGKLEAANSTPGNIIELGDGYVVVRDIFGHEIKVVPVELPVERILGYEPGTIKQLPLHPAFAMTVAKSQGQTFFGDVILHCYHINKKGQVSPCSQNNALLVMASRVTSLDKLWFATPQGVDEDFDLVDCVTKGFKTNMEAVAWMRPLPSPVLKTLEVVEEEEDLEF